MSNSADDLSQLIDHAPYQFEVFGQNFNDMDDGNDDCVFIKVCLNENN